MFKKLLVPLDRSPLAEQALGRAAAIARESHASIDVMLVHEPLPFAGFRDAPWNAEEWKLEDKYVETIADELSTGAAIPATHCVMRGEPVELICLHARDINADLIVMTSHGRTGLSRMWLGSVAHAVLHQSPAPVLLLRPVEGKSRHDETHHLFKHILLPLDGSAFSAEMIAHATALARCSGAKLTLLRVVRPVPSVILDVGMPFAYPPMIPDQAITDQLVEEARGEMTEVARRINSDGGGSIDAHVVVADGVAQAIIDFARGHSVDAVAMSTHGRGASRLFMGSVADKVVRGSELPMLLHRPIGVSDEAKPRNFILKEESAPSLAGV